jgi:hypothetical protein
LPPKSAASIRGIAWEHQRNARTEHSNNHAQLSARR